MGRLLFVILISLFAVKASLADQPTAESSHTTGDILGSVNICPQLGVDRVVAYIPGRSYVVRSAPNGSFEFNFVPEGMYDIAFESNGARVGSLSGVVVTSNSEPIWARSLYVSMQTGTALTLRRTVTTRTRISTRTP